MRIIDCEQRSDSWFTHRLGRVTSSVAAEMLSTLKSGKGEAAGRRNLRVRLALEQITGVSQERQFQPTQAMLNGVDREAAALAAYESLTVELVSRVGFLAHDTLMAGASLDAYVGDFETVVEAKAPLAATHLETLRTRQVPGDYLRQITHQLWMVPTATSAQFVSYCPEFPDGLKIVSIMVPRSSVDIAAYDAAVTEFLAEVDREVAAVRGLMEK